MAITIRPVKGRSDLKKFILLPWKIYKNDPVWVPPLIADRKQILNKKKNPFFEHAEAEYFLAECDGEVVGRITAQIDRLHNETHKEKTGFFGFFESIDDQQVANALLDQAASWLKARGMTEIRGPFSFSINEESGALLTGFEHPPVILMAHTPPYYLTLLEAWGLKKAKDLLCWNYDVLKPIPEEPLKVAEEVWKFPGLKVREVDVKNKKKEIEVILDIFNSSWSKNWGFVPATPKEVEKTIKDLSLIIDPFMALIAEVDGNPVAICVVVPNINEAIRDLNGRLFPFGIFKLLYRIKRKKTTTGRLMLLGVKKEYRHVMGGLSVLLNTEIHRRGKIAGYKTCELSWTLEDNDRVNMGIEFMGGRVYKTYRVYQKEIA
jgi:hypothetical protein